jgi:hypothetical protein
VTGPERGAPGAGGRYGGERGPRDPGRRDPRAREGRDLRRRDSPGAARDPWVSGDPGLSRDRATGEPGSAHDRGTSDRGTRERRDPHAGHDARDRRDSRPGHEARPAPLASGAARRPYAPRGGARLARRRSPFVVLLVTLLAGGLLALLLLNAAVNQDSFQLSHLQKENTQLTDEEQALQQEVDGYSAPGDLERRAAKLGMVPGTDPVFLGPRGGLHGSPTPATAPPSPTPTSSPSPSPGPAGTATPAGTGAGNGGDAGNGTGASRGTGATAGPAADLTVTTLGQEIP